MNESTAMIESEDIVASHPEIVSNGNDSSEEQYVTGEVAQHTLSRSWCELGHPVTV